MREDVKGPLRKGKTWASTDGRNISRPDKMLSGQGVEEALGIVKKKVFEIKGPVLLIVWLVLDAVLRKRAGRSCKKGGGNAKGRG